MNFLFFRNLADMEITIRLAMLFEMKYLFFLSRLVSSQLLIRSHLIFAKNYDFFQRYLIIQEIMYFLLDSIYNYVYKHHIYHYFINNRLEYLIKQFHNWI